MRVKFFISLSENKCSIIEIAQKNIQRRLYSYMVQNETLKYLRVLPQICFAYNSSVNRTINLSPEEAKQTANSKRILHLNLQKFHKLKKLKIKPRFQIGDIVRVSIDKSKTPFARSYNLQNSYAKYEIYKIIKRDTVHPKYYLKHVASDKLIKNGYFYDWQLTLCTSNTFRGRVIKERTRKGKKEYLFSFKGYPPEFNEWKSQAELESIK